MPFSLNFPAIEAIIFEIACLFKKLFVTLQPAGVVVSVMQFFTCKDTKNIPLLQLLIVIYCIDNQEYS